MHRSGIYRTYGAQIKGLEITINIPLLTELRYSTNPTGSMNSVHTHELNELYKLYKRL